MENNKNNSADIRRWVFRVLLFIYDMFAINFAYFMAIIIRFYASHQFHDLGAHYMVMFRDFVPYYTGACVVIFILFRLYSSVWRYVGMHDVHRIVLANMCTCALYVGGSLLIVGRMPLTVYGIGACIQFFMMAVPRIAPRYIIDSFGTGPVSRDSSMEIPLMIVGVGENTRIIQNRIGKDKAGLVRPVCVADYEYKYRGSTFNGLPVVSGEEGMLTAVEKYDVKCMILADDSLPDKALDGIHKVCEERGIELRDFALRAEFRGAVGLRELLETTDGPVRIVEGGTGAGRARDGERFPDGNAALRAYPGHYMVESVTAGQDGLCIRVRRTGMAHTSLKDDWVEKYREETGSEVGFF